MTKRDGSTISYSSYNLPTVINQGSNSSTLSYGAFRNRYKQVAVSAGATETTLYVAGLFEKVTLPGGVVEYRHYIPGGNGTAAIHTRRSSGTNSTYYWHADHLGSPELFTNSGGGEEVRPSFGAFGERRDGSDWLGPPSAADLAKIAGITRRGFTGHEHLDSVGLIHMNGRVYDPGIGRFLGVDPIVGVGVSQDANSYNYAWNSPLNVVDPSGLTDVVVNCQNCDWRRVDSADAFDFMNREGDLWEPGPRDYTPPAAACVDGNANCNFVVSSYWDGDSALAGRAGPMYGLSTVDGTWSAWSLLGISTANAADLPSLYRNLGSDFVMRMDSVPGTDIYEFHVYENSAAFRKAVGARGPLESFERGVVGPDGTFIAKHGRSSAIPKLPASVHTAIRGVVADEARARTWIGEKGTVNIKGRNLTDQIHIGMRRTGSFRYLSVLGRTLGIVGVGTTIFHPSIDKACELDPTFEGC